MQLYDILKAGKTDKAPDSRTLLLARKLFPPPNSGLPVTRGLRSVLHLADFDAQKSTWTDTTFGKVYTGASVYHQSYGVCMNANEPLFSGFNFNTDDFTMYIITTAKDYYATWSHYLVGSSDGKDNWSFMHSNQWRELSNGNSSSSNMDIFSTCHGTITDYSGSPYLSCIRYNHANGCVTCESAGIKLPYYYQSIKTDPKPSDWSMRVECNCNRTSGTPSDFTSSWVKSYIKFVAAATAYHSDSEVEKNLAWIRSNYHVVN